MQDMIVGIDFCKDYTQLSVFNRTTLTPDSIALKNDKSSLRAQTAVSLMKENGEWLVYSEKHKDAKEQFDCVLNLYELACKGENFQLDDKEYHIDVVLMKFFKKILSAARPDFSGNDIKGLVISIKEHDEGLEKTLALAMENLGIPVECYKIMTHIECFMYFVVKQNKDIWLNDVEIFDFDEEGFKSYLIKFGRKQQPLTIVAESSDFSEQIKYDMLETEKSKLLYSFENICGVLLNKQQISAIYATGNGFDSSWADEILKKQCNGRRIFRGQNLYVKGAAYAALLAYESKDDGYLIIGEDALKCSISMRVVSHGENVEVPFGIIGQKYTEAGGSAEIIMDRTDEIDFMIHNSMKKDFFCAIMTLDSLHFDREKTTRLKVDVCFKNRDAAIITVRDVGFGAFRQTDYRIWEQVINL